MDSANESSCSEGETGAVELIVIEFGLSSCLYSLLLFYFVHKRLIIDLNLFLKTLLKTCDSLISTLT